MHKISAAIAPFAGAAAAGAFAAETISWKIRNRKGAKTVSTSKTNTVDSWWEEQALHAKAVETFYENLEAGKYFTGKQSFEELKDAEVKREYIRLKAGLK